MHCYSAHFRFLTIQQGHGYSIKLSCGMSRLELTRDMLLGLIHHPAWFQRVIPRFRITNIGYFENKLDILFERDDGPGVVFIT